MVIHTVQKEKKDKRKKHKKMNNKRTSESTAVKNNLLITS